MKLHKVMQKAEQSLKRRSNPNSKVIETFNWNGGSVDIIERLGVGNTAIAYLGSDGMVYLTVRSDEGDQSKMFLAMYIKDLKEKNKPLPKHLPPIEFLGRSHFDHHEWDLFRMPVYKMPLHMQDGWDNDAWVIEEMCLDVHHPSDFDDELLESYRGDFKDESHFDQVFWAMQELFEFSDWAENRGTSAPRLDIVDFNNGLDNNGRLIFVDPLIMLGNFRP
jgi:hypothetical protein